MTESAKNLVPNYADEPVSADDTFGELIHLNSDPGYRDPNVVDLVYEYYWDLVLNKIPDDQMCSELPAAIGRELDQMDLDEEILDILLGTRESLIFITRWSKYYRARVMGGVDPYMY